MRTVNTDSHSRTHVRTHTHIHTQHELPLLLFHSFINRSVQLPILTRAEFSHKTKPDFNSSDTDLFFRDALQEKHSVSGSLSWRWRGHYCACQVRVNFYRVMSLVHVLCNMTQIYYNHDTYKGTRN